MMLRAHTCAHARASSGTMSPPFVLCVLCAALRGGGDRRARSRRTTYMPLCTRSEVCIRLVCPGIGLSQGAATTRAQSRRRPKSQHAVRSKFAFESPMGGSLLDPHECAFFVSYRTLACAWPAGSGGGESGAALWGRCASDWLIAELTHQAHGATKKNRVFILDF